MNAVQSFAYNMLFSLKVLNFAGNRLGVLSDGLFMSANLPNLQEIVVSDCDVRDVRQFAFAGLSNLVALDLSNNDLKQVPSNALKEAPHLRQLRLSGNPLTALPAAAFSGLGQLDRLELSSCDLINVDVDAFVGLPSLSRLRLDGNMLKRLSPRPLAPLSHSLVAIQLHRNPMACDCRLRALRQWLNSNNVPPTVPPTCEGPARIAGKAWDDLTDDDFACKPQVLRAGVAGPAVPNVGNGNVTMFCLVGGSPPPRVAWLWQDQELRNGSKSSKATFSIEERLKEDAVTVDEKGEIVMGYGERASYLKVTNGEAGENGGEYLCVARSRGGQSAPAAVRPALPVATPVEDHEGADDAAATAHAEAPNRSVYVMAAFGGCAVIFLTLFFVCCVYSIRQKPGVMGTRYPRLPDDGGEATLVEMPSANGYLRVPSRAAETPRQTFQLSGAGGEGKDIKRAGEAVKDPDSDASTAHAAATALQNGSSVLKKQLSLDIQSVTLAPAALQKAPPASSSTTTQKSHSVTDIRRRQGRRESEGAVEHRGRPHRPLRPLSVGGLGDAVGLQQRSVRFNLSTYDAGDEGVRDYDDEPGAMRLRSPSDPSITLAEAVRARDRRVRFSRSREDGDTLPTHTCKRGRREQRHREDSGSRRRQERDDEEFRRWSAFLLSKLAAEDNGLSSTLPLRGERRTGERSKDLILLSPLLRESYDGSADSGDSASDVGGGGNAQLARFLREYRGLQLQLARMREACDDLRRAAGDQHRHQQLQPLRPILKSESSGQQRRPGANVSPPERGAHASGRPLGGMLPSS